MSHDVQVIDDLKLRLNEHRDKLEATQHLVRKLNSRIEGYRAKIEAAEVEIRQAMEGIEFHRVAIQDLKSRMGGNHG